MLQRASQVVRRDAEAYAVPLDIRVLRLTVYCLAARQQTRSMCDKLSSSKLITHARVCDCAARQ